jgi:hypothetical protein
MSAVELAVQQRIAQARVRIQAARERRDELSTARRRGLAARHAAKLRNLRDSEQRRRDDEQRQDDDQGDGDARQELDVRLTRPSL